MNKYYAVLKGQKPGIYSSWSECEQQVKGFSGAKYRSFKNLADAKKYLSKPTQPPKQTKTDYDVLLYTDGGTRNTGNVMGGHVKASDKAAWAYLIKGKTFTEHDSAGVFGATNNQMELTAVLKGLECLLDLGRSHSSILLISDSRYVVDAINKNWLQSWQRRGWKKADGQPVANLEIWQQIVAQLQQFTQLQVSWTKGHANNAGNNFVDQLLNQTMDHM